MKVCTKCGVEKEHNKFDKSSTSKDNYKSVCKECRKIESKEYYQKNKEKLSEKAKNSSRIKAYQKEYGKKNKEKLDEYKKEYYQKHNEFLKEKTKEYRVKNKEKIKEYREKNKDKKKEYNKEYGRCNRKRILDKRFSNPKNIVKKRIRDRVADGFRKYSKNGKTKSCKDYGIDFEAIFNRIGARPEGNYHLDHIIPLCKFDFDNPEHVRLAHLPENLQWLTEEDNLTKNDYIDLQLIRCSLALTIIAQEIGLI